MTRGSNTRSSLQVIAATTRALAPDGARSKGGKFVLRIEDTDLERSTRASEEALLLRLMIAHHYNAGPGVGGDYGPYRQSERNVMYRQYAEKLLKSGHVYRCFCSNEVIGFYLWESFYGQFYFFSGTRKNEGDAKLKELPPVYTGKWSNATDEEVEEELEKGTPYTFRFRVPKEGRLQINDLIRGEVSWSLDTLGDFVIMRSNGQPVYNFCVTVDDATMAISHVIRLHFLCHFLLSLSPPSPRNFHFRAEEHLPNTLRQALIYKVILCGPNLSLMLSYFQVTNIFIHLEVAVTKPLTKLIGQHWKSTGILAESEGMFVEEAVELLKDGIDLITDSDKALSNLLSYPLYATLARVHGLSFLSPDQLCGIISPEGKPVLQDGLPEVASSLLATYDSGELLGALEEGNVGWKSWVKSFGKSMNRKLLFLLENSLHASSGAANGKASWPRNGATVLLLHRAGTSNVVADQAGFIALDDRFKMLRDTKWESFNNDQTVLESVATVP
ncbi:hypothetical protein C3L33_11480, partial [Rhododendron williamsianum]